MDTKRVLVLLLLLLLLSTPSIRGEGIYVEVEGVGMITGGNLVRAREMAITDGLRKAVEQAIGIHLDSQTIVKNYVAIEDSILLQSHGYIASYDLLESWSSQGILYVRLGVVVKERILKDDLQALNLIIQRAGDPRIMVIIPEEHISRFIPDPAAETEVIRQLLEAGFRVVDQTQVSRVRDSEMIRRALEGDIGAYHWLQEEYNADLLVLGEAFSELVGTYYGFFSCRARVEVRVVRSDTGEILAAHGIHESGVDITESTASKKSLMNAGASMASYLIEVLPRGLSESLRSIQVTLGSISFRDLQTFMDHVKDFYLVEDAYLREYAGRNARIDIKTSLLPMGLAQEIVDWIPLPLEVVGISGSRIDLTIE